MISLLLRLISFVVLALVGLQKIHATHDVNWAWLGLAVFVFSFVIDDAPYPYGRRRQ